MTGLVGCAWLTATGCRTNKTPARAADVATTESVIRKSLDSCNGLATGPDSSKAARDSARTAMRLAGHVRLFDSFSFFLPDGVAASARNATSIEMNGWAACPDCR